MALLETWRNLAYGDGLNDKKKEELWSGYFQIEKGIYEQILSDVRWRDEQDSTREAAPLRQAEDAVLLDSTGLSLEQVVARIVALAGEGEDA